MRLFSFSRLLAADQQIMTEPPGRITPASELVNAFEFENMAQRKLDSVVFSEVAGSDRKAIDRITFHPRMMVNTTKLNLTTNLFGAELFTPVLIGPVADQKRFHPEGELAMARGAAAAKTAMIVSGRSSFPIDQIAAQAKTPLWYQVYPEPDAAAVKARIESAVKAGCKAIVITTGIPDRPAGGKGAPQLIDWGAIDRIRQGISVPVLWKGVTSPEEAQLAVSHGFAGIVVSNYGGRAMPGTSSAILTLPAIADAVGGKAKILIDGSFRRGSDVLKALALGAQAVVISRPAIWGLAAYGPEGVQNLLGLIQNELARDMVMCGLPNIQSITRAAVTIHRR